MSPRDSTATHHCISLVLFSFAHERFKLFRFSHRSSHLSVIDFVLSVRHQGLPGAASDFAVRRSLPLSILFHFVCTKTGRNTEIAEQIRAVGRRDLYS